MSATSIIEVGDLVKVYGKGESATRAVDGITFDVERGTLFGLLGPNGAGKTTTIRILATLLDATEGKVRVDGLDVHEEPHEVRKRLGLALQTAALDAFSTGRETLVLAGRMHRLPSAEIKRRSDELLELMTLTKVAGKLTGTYSGGMKRRLDLASRPHAPAAARSSSTSPPRASTRRAAPRSGRSSSASTRPARACS